MSSVSNRRRLVLVLALTMASMPSWQARPAQAQTTTAAPTLIPVGGQFLTAEGAPRPGTAVLVISLYEGRDDSAPRWIEHQTVTLDAEGRYNIQFGATRPE